MDTQERDYERYIDTAAGVFRKDDPSGVVHLRRHGTFVHLLVNNKIGNLADVYLSHEQAAELMMALGAAAEPL